MLTGTRTRTWSLADNCLWSQTEVNANRSARPSALEVALRNTLDGRLAARHRRLGRPGSWLDDLEEELSTRARLDITSARDRVRQKGKRASDGQTISELSFGFWRFLVTKKLTGLWPDLASGFSHAPNRQLTTVEGPLARLHVFRNRLAHHQRVGVTLQKNATKTSSSSPVTSSPLFHPG